MAEDTTTVPGSTLQAKPIALARLAVVGKKDQAVTVHFNPASLQLQLSNELKDTSKTDHKQFIAKITAKLTMDLQFDTTNSGEDVMKTTRQIQAFLAPPAPAGGREKKQIPPPVVLFEWGTLSFQGVAESYKETIDFFSANGVPLRASVNLTLSRQDQVFDEKPDQDGGVKDDTDAQDIASDSAAAAANGMQSPGSARAVAAANGQESVRFGSGAGLTVGGSIELKPARAFASGGAGISLGGGAGIVGSASAGISGMARLSATEGAFSGLRVTASAPSFVRLDPSKLVPKIESTTVATDAGATFKVGGKANFAGTAGLRADVGAAGKLSFDAT
ncbi:MAG: hypothetical protein WCF18_09380 [Chthoniobacteraceae bacterium]